MVYENIIIDISKLRHYYPKLKDIYNANKPIYDEAILYHADIALDISKDEKDVFEQLYLLLMRKFNIPEQSYTDIFYITQYMTFQSQTIEFLDDLDPQTTHALNFLIGYQELVKEVDEKKQNNVGEISKSDPIIIQVKNKKANGAIPLYYDGSGRLIVNMIYKAFKTTFHNTTLSHLLDDYPDIPPLEKLKELKTPGQDKKERIAKEMLGETARILSQYFIDYLPVGLLNRKKNLLVYELFYLFNTLQYAGKVKEINSSSLIRKQLNIPYLLPLDKTTHSSFITEFIKNHNKRDKDPSGAFLKVR